ncbi:MAG: DNA starvation/stationary phase protection protein, partial [Bacteroidetes bacterium]|nr:DNA starvation/stationary phase protection protein [Bacteroidota bacterium]
MKPDIGIPEKHLQTVANELQKLLADEYVLYTKTRNYHWNVEGENFMEMHKFFESQYEELDDIIDEVAERIRKIGHHSEARLKDFIELARLDEPAYTNDQSKQLKNLLSDHETIIKALRKNITEFADECKDLGSSDFVTGLMQKHETMAWF